MNIRTLHLGRRESIFFLWMLAFEGKKSVMGDREGRRDGETKRKGKRVKTRQSVKVVTEIEGKGRREEKCQYDVMSG